MMSMDEQASQAADQRAQVRRVRKWIFAIMGGTLTVVVIWSMTSGGSSEGSVGAPSGSADVTACSLLQEGLDAVASGTPLTAAMDSVMSQGWPNGQPSEAVRGVYSGFRSAVAAEKNYLDGAGTFDQASSAFQDAFSNYESVCK